MDVAFNSQPAAKHIYTSEERARCPEFGTPEYWALMGLERWHYFGPHEAGTYGALNRELKHGRTRLVEARQQGNRKLVDELTAWLSLHPFEYRPVEEFHHAFSELATSYAAQMVG